MSTKKIKVHATVEIKETIDASDFSLATLKEFDPKKHWKGPTEVTAVSKTYIKAGETTREVSSSYYDTVPAKMKSVLILRDAVLGLLKQAESKEMPFEYGVETFCVALLAAALEKRGMREPTNEEMQPMITAMIELFINARPIIYAAIGVDSSLPSDDILRKMAKGQTVH